MNCAQVRVVEDAFELAVVELRHVVALERPLQTPLHVQPGERHRAVLRHRRDEQVELLIAEHVGEGDLRAAEHVAAARHAERDRRPALEEQLLELALLLLVVRHQRVHQRRLEVDDRPGRSEVGRRDLGDLVLALEDVQAVLALEVGDERQRGCAGASLQHHRRDVARQRVGVLLQLVGLQVERPEVVDLPVLRDLRLDRLGRVHRRRREHQRVGVEELRAALVVRAEGQLRRVARRRRPCGTASRCR